MAGSSFINELDRKLRWNPHPRDWDSTQLVFWDETPESVLQRRKENPLEFAKHCAEASARLLSGFHEGRVLLDAEEPGEYKEDPEYWSARAAYYRAEYDKLGKEQQQRREPTPEISSPWSWKTELDRAKGSAGNAAIVLSRFPAGRTLLAAEDLRDSATDPEYWWNKKEYYEAKYKETELERAKRSADAAARDLAYFPAGKALLESESYRESAADPGYWLRKQKDYIAEYRKLKENFWACWRRVHLDGGESLSKALNNLGPTNYYDTKTELGRAKRFAENAARDLAQFPAGEALLEAEDHRESTTDAGYWRSKERFYVAEYWKLTEEFWACWKQIHLEGGESPADASKPKTRARRSSITRRSRATRSTGSNTRQGKKSDQLQSKTIASHRNAFAGVRKIRDGRPAGRRKSKDEHPCQNTHISERKPSLLPLPQRPSSPYVTPQSAEARSSILGSYKVTELKADGEPSKSCSQSQNPYVTPSSPDFDEATVRYRRKHKGAVRQKRRRDADSTYHGAIAVSQPLRPISSRLRSSSGYKGATARYRRRALIEIRQRHNRIQLRN